ncbi:MAG: hypothetical protein AB7L84_09790 [Acidimicrobiia bacterium]
MTTLKHSSYASIATALSTELNSLANNSLTAASSAIDNTSALELFADLELVVAAQGSARSAGAVVDVYIVPSVDGTNYADLEATCSEPIATFALDAATTARRLAARDIPIPPGLFKLAVRNRTGQSFASSGSTLKYRTHSVQQA